MKNDETPAHTPRVWAAEDRGTGDWLVRHEATGAALALVYGDDQHPEISRRTDIPAEENARLIAAAPDLHAALDQLLRFCRDYWASGGDDFSAFDPAAPEGIAVDAMAALAKARGE